jgi:hypothetical protein
MVKRDTGASLQKTEQILQAKTALTGKMGIVKIGD